MDPRMIPKGSGPEYNHDGQGGQARPNEAGVYFHPHAGKFIETTGTKRPDGSMAYAKEAGKIQGDAFKQIGYREANEEEKAGYQAAQKAIEMVKRVKQSRTVTSMSSPARR